MCFDVKFKKVKQQSDHASLTIVDLLLMVNQADLKNMKLDKSIKSDH